MPRKLVVVIAVAAAVAIAGGAYAATQSSSTNPRQAYVNDVAKRLNVTPAKLRAALQGALVDRLNAAVAAGKLSKAQASAIKQRIAQGAPFGLAAVHPFMRPRFFGGPGGPGGPGMPGGPGGPGGPGMPPPGIAAVANHGPLAAAATYLGISRVQLFKDLASGKSLAQLATAEHKSVSGLKQAVVSAIKSRLDAAVKAKMLTSAQEQKILSRISAVVDQKAMHAGWGFRLHRRAGGPPPGLFGRARVPVAPLSPSA